MASEQGRSLMDTAAKRKAKIPRFRTDAEERTFWAHHSVEGFAGELEDLDVAIRPARTEQIAVRLYKDDLEALQSLAAKHGVGHTTLARSVLEGWLARARSVRRPGSRRKARRPA
jgi:predicted DNA binding CopG/RHH family protein